ncbi:MAG TPA: phosphate ABC transporter substrate-binding protein PstS [Candidatus Binatia bacterium]|jgi:phosphate transport system substrate-binding protein
MTYRATSLLACLALILSVGTASASCPKKGVKELTGAGGTFIYPLMSKWSQEYQKACEVKVNYQSIGSGGGISQLQKLIVDFGESDAIMTDQQKKEAQGGPILHIPLAAGAVAIAINLPGINAGQLKLTPDVLSDIYLKKITNWNDKRIAAANSGMKLPDLTIAVVHRSDGSGTTFIFTDYLSKVSSEWKTKVGSATSVNWPGDVGGKGNEGVASSVKQIPGAIGYVELAYVNQNKMPYAVLRNKAGKFVEPTLQSAAAAADVANLPDNMEVMITDSANPNAYPITGFTWLLLYANQRDTAKADVVTNFAWWMIHDGQQYATPLDYAQLKGAAVKKAEALVKEVKVDGSVVMK